MPSIYYGDEIGMRYLPRLPDVEGSVCHPTYNRAGARTPMQWDGTANAGCTERSGTSRQAPAEVARSRCLP